MIARGLWPDGRFDLAGVLDVLGRPRVHRVVWFTLWSSSVATVATLLLGVPSAYVLHRLDLSRRSSAQGRAPRAFRASDRGRRGGLPAADLRRRASRPPRPRRYGDSDHRRPGVLQRGRRHPGGGHLLGEPRPEAGRGRRGAGCLAAPGVHQRHTADAASRDRLRGQRRVPVLRHRLRGGADPRRAAVLHRWRPRSTCSPRSCSTCRPRQHSLCSSWRR